MKRILLYIALALPVFGIVSCNKFLDELPDHRAELDTKAEIAQMLVTAYPSELPTAMFELMGDNVTDNGPLFGVSDLGALEEDSYFWRDVADQGWDDRRQVWENCYLAIASANQAIAAVEEQGDPDDMQDVKAEAKLCRAFNHFILVNTFCIAYNPETSETDMGIPYSLAPETAVNPKYDRETVAKTYSRIDQDIEEALPFISEEYMTKPKYHFNAQAAYAFAARFNLFYGKWDKVITYATEALGDAPESFLRDWTQYEGLSGESWNMEYIKSTERANFLILPQRSVWWRTMIGYPFESGGRYANNVSWTYTNYRQYFPWLAAALTNGWGYITQAVYIPTVWEIMEVIDPVAGTGQPHTVLMYFTADETLACRAEAYVMKEEYQKAADDLNIWYLHQSGETCAIDDILWWYASDKSLTSGLKVYDRPMINSKFGVAEGTQANMLRAVLSYRQFETIFKGMRFMDIKRHGITVDHRVQNTQVASEAEIITLSPYDPRTAIQIPDGVILAGLPANPR